MKLDEIAEDKVQIYVDMDGVLMDFVAGITKLLDKPYSEEKYKTSEAYRKEMWKVVGDYSKKGGKLWGDLPLMSDAKKLWKYVKRHNPQILTATGQPSFGAEKQKRESIKKHFGRNIRVNVVESGKDKAQYANPGDILIDDQLKVINPWKAAGGIGILHTSADKTIAELKKLGY